MPSTLTPPELEIRRPAVEHDHGAGSLPPVIPPRDKRTGGNGDDGDDFGAAEAGRRGPRDRLKSARIGMAAALLGVFLIFATLIFVFMESKANYRVNAYHHVVTTWRATRPPRILWLDTVVLFLSSFTAEMGRRAMFHEKSIMDEWFGLGRPTSRRASRWLFVTLALGMLFLVGQWIAWLQLGVVREAYETRSSVEVFYLITATHALHLFAGVTLMIGTLALLRSSRQFATRQIWVDSTVWYWHAMGVLWIMLFVLLEFFQ